MSNSINTCAITCTGYLTQKPTDTQYGIAFPLMVTMWADGGMVEQEFEVSFSGKRAERVKQYLERDKRVCVSGTLRISESGGLAVSAYDLELLGKRYTEDAKGKGFRGFNTQGKAQGAGVAPQPAQSTARGVDEYGPAPDDEDIPF